MNPLYDHSHVEPRKFNWTLVTGLLAIGVFWFFCGGRV